MTKTVSAERRTGQSDRRNEKQQMIHRGRKTQTEKRGRREKLGEEKFKSGVGGMCSRMGK